MNRSNLLYSFTAFLLGLLWFFLLRIPLANEILQMPFGERDRLEITALIFCLSSFATALIFKTKILEKDVWVLGLYLPFFGMLLFTWGFFLSVCSWSNFKKPGELGLAFFAYPVVAFVATLFSIYVVYPAGVLWVAILKWVAIREEAKTAS